MKKELIIAVMILMLLVACGSKTTGKRVAIPDTAPKLSGPTGAVAGVPTTAPATVETGKTAAEMLKEIQTTGTEAIPATGPKTGNLYPQINTTATGKDALAERTTAMMRQAGFVPTVDKVIRDTGAKYHSSSGDVINLPGNYTDSSGN
ncbi:Uncharacterised protein [uncultured archaeon]|nr:Uncharacterised protein [uncultured archaeon]